MASRRELLDLIGSVESAKGYNYEFGNKDLPLDEMTLDEVLRHQEKRRGEGAKSSAVGRYQFIHKTLNDIVRRNPNDFPRDSLFTAEMQDKAADLLLNRRGAREYESGELDEDVFLKNISKEWASMPNPDTGASYYDEDGLNKSLVGTESVRGAARTLRRSSEEEALQQSMLSQALRQQ